MADQFVLQVDADNVSEPENSPVSLLYSGDIRMLLAGSRTFVLQLAHPSVGAGVMQFSKFMDDPWSRFREISYSGQQMTFGDHASALKEGQRLRAMHRGIKGVDSRGQSYHALNPETYGWVHFVFLESMLTTHELFAGPVPREHQEILFREWRHSGGYFGLREEDMPSSLEEYWQRFNARVEDTLEYNDAIDFILSLDRNAPPKPAQFSGMPDLLWRNLWKPIGRRSTLATVGSLPLGYRQKFADHIRWSDRDEKKFRRACRQIRTLVNALPLRFRLMPPAWQKYRRLMESVR